MSNPDRGLHERTTKRLIAEEEARARESQESKQSGRDEERARVVKWLRFVPVNSPASALADLIEAGTHWNEEQSHDTTG